jgi:hypothetical protein
MIVMHCAPPRTGRAYTTPMNRSLDHDRRFEQATVPDARASERHPKYSTAFAAVP